MITIFVYYDIDSLLFLLKIFIWMNIHISSFYYELVMVEYAWLTFIGSIAQQKQAAVFSNLFSFLLLALPPHWFVGMTTTA
jgi:hypothetical protein